MGSLEELSGWVAAAIAAATSVYQAYTGRKKDAEHRVELAQEHEERFPRIVVERSFARPAQVDLALALRNEQPHDRSLITLVGYSALAGRGISRQNRWRIRVCEDPPPRFHPFWSLCWIRRALFFEFCALRFRRHVAACMMLRMRTMLYAAIANVKTAETRA